MIYAILYVTFFASLRLWFSTHQSLRKWMTSSISSEEALFSWRCLLSSVSSARTCKGLTITNSTRSQGRFGGSKFFFLMNKSHVGRASTRPKSFTASWPLKEVNLLKSCCFGRNPSAWSSGLWIISNVCQIGLQLVLSLTPRSNHSMLEPECVKNTSD